MLGSWLRDSPGSVSSGAEPTGVCPAATWPREGNWGSQTTPTATTHQTQPLLPPSDKMQSTPGGQKGRGKAAWHAGTLGAQRGPGREGGHCHYLHGVLQLGVLVVEDAEAERLLGDHFHEHEVATLCGRARQVSTRGREWAWPVTHTQTYRDVSFVRERVVSLLRDEKQLVEKEEGPFVLGPLDAEGSFEHQLPVAGQVWPLPVGEQTLYFLKEGQGPT